MNELEKLLGDPLYGRVKEKLGDAKLLIDNGNYIPKHRFDCVNISLRDHKEELLRLREENKRLEKLSDSLSACTEKCRELEKKLAVFDVVSESRARNPKAVLALLDTENAKPENLREHLTRQLKKLKKTDPYLFEDTITYKLVPCLGDGKEK